MTAPAIAPAVHDWRLWTVDARLVVTDPAALEQAIETCRRITEEVDELASRFRADSLVRRLELTGADQTPIPAVFSALLREALAAAELTDGDLDPTLGRAMQALGRPAASTSTHTLDDGTRLALVDPAPMWRRIRLDTTRDLLTMPAGVLIDLGATAKAQTADWCARAIAEQTGRACSSASAVTSRRRAPARTVAGRCTCRTCPTTQSRSSPCARAWRSRPRRCRNAAGPPPARPRTTSSTRAR